MEVFNFDLCMYIAFFVLVNVQCYIAVYQATDEIQIHSSIQAIDRCNSRAIQISVLLLDWNTTIDQKHHGFTFCFE